MADDAPFNPPLGEVTPPGLQADAGEIVRQVRALLERQGAAGLDVVGACARRGDAPWIALVSVHIGEASWLMTPATARRVADAVAASRFFAVVVEGDIAASFRTCADRAEQMAAGELSFCKQEELN